MQIMSISRSIIGVRTSGTESHRSFADFLNSGIDVRFSEIVLRIPDCLRLAVLEADHVVFPVHISGLETGDDRYSYQSPK